MNKQFAAPDLDIEQFVERFENEARDIYVKRQDITRAVGLKAGEAVADIGAGTGLFTQLFAEQVGLNGIVYAVDIGPAFLKHITEQARRHRHEKVIKTVLNTRDSTDLPAGSIDVAFLCDTYHHFEHPEKMLASIHRALRPGGRLVVIDFDLRKDSSEFVKQRARAPKGVYFADVVRDRYGSIAKSSLSSAHEGVRAVAAPRPPPRRRLHCTKAWLPFVHAITSTNSRRA